LEKKSSVKKRRTNESDISSLIANAAEPLPQIEDQKFGSFFDRFANSKIVLLGEARFLLDAIFVSKNNFASKISH